MQLLGLVPMHSDTQEFVRVAGCIETLTAGTWKTRSGLEVGIAYSTIRSAEASFAWSRLRYGPKIPVRSSLLR
jgi:hypothetical protein